MTQSKIHGVFAQCVAQWRAETCFVSSTSALLRHSAMQRIIAMGKPAIPLILQEVTIHPDWLVIALHEITGENPVPVEDYGRLQNVIAAWIRWGTANDQI